MLASWGWLPGERGGERDHLPKVRPEQKDGGREMAVQGGPGT